MDRAKKAVNGQEVAPNVKIVLHRNNNTYTQSTGVKFKGGIYVAPTYTLTYLEQKKVL